MINEKRIYGNLAGITHSAIHGLLTTVWFLIMKPEVAIMVGLFDMFCHYHIDFLKVQMTKSKKLTPADKDFWTYLGVDQYLHYMTYCLILKFF